jgi:hypothetical protein
MPRVCTVFHAFQFLQMNHLLSLLLFLLVLSVLTRFAVMEHAKLEQIDFGACTGYLGYPFLKEASWAFTTRLFLVVKWDSATEIAGK